MPARKKGILEIASHQFSSFVSEVEQLSPYQTEVEPKTLSGSRRKKHFRGAHLQDPKGYHILEWACVNIPTPVSIGKVLQQEGEKKAGLFLFTLPAQGKQDATHTWAPEFVYLFTYGQQKGFELYLPRAGEESEIRFSCMDEPGLCVASRALLFPGSAGISAWDEQSQPQQPGTGRDWEKPALNLCLLQHVQGSEQLCVMREEIKFQQLLHQELCQVGSSTVRHSLIKLREVIDLNPEHKPGKVLASSFCHQNPK